MVDAVWILKRMRSLCNSYPVRSAYTLVQVLVMYTELLLVYVVYSHERAVIEMSSTRKKDSHGYSSTTM